MSSELPIVLNNRDSANRRTPDGRIIWDIGTFPDSVAQALDLDTVQIKTLSNYLATTLATYDTTIGNTNEAAYNANGTIDTIDIHAFTIPLITQLIKLGYKPFASCQGYITPESLTKERINQYANSLVFTITDNNTLDGVFRVRAKHKEDEIAYLVLQYNENLYQPLLTQYGQSITEHDNNLGFYIKISENNFARGLRGKVMSIYSNNTTQGWTAIEKALEPIIMTVNT